MLVKIMRYKEIVKDILINLLSVMLVMTVIQLLVFPYLSRKLPDELFGQIIALYGMNNMIILFLGNTLGNVRMLKQHEDVDFSLLSQLTMIASLVIMALLSFYYGSAFSLGTNCLFVLFTGLANLRAYTTVDYRISLTYNKVLRLNFCLVCGYLIGGIIFYFTSSWVWIFLAGEIGGLLYQWGSKNNLLIECFTTFSKKVDTKMWREFFSLSTSNGFANVANYLDRFVITPLLGATSMGVYYAASSLSKILTMMITPMSSVLLSYTTNQTIGFARKKILTLYAIMLGIVIPSYFILITLSNYLVTILYPNYAHEAKPLLPIVTIGILLNVIYSVLHPFILKKYSIHYQMVIQVIYLIFYGVLSIVLSHRNGLIGFAWAFSLASVIKLFMQLVIVVFKKEPSRKTLLS
ncbi:lipopolysaccharide biosynthesis protein [Enterococcus ureasiticus]|uniref:Polysaccharide biosynthesis protein n=1 Tax=Enterococcus ureasiticus TaxID=903984 RepID=A0A1E5GH68_9ENTE|nr:hypothetical protein [Enterococcus ureasiticus]OEG11961.1 hypothetical protein BCR21_06915 [Enterococcus ureasiticus]